MFVVAKCHAQGLKIIAKRDHIAPHLQGMLKTA
jgi:hypothetical protein